MLNMHKINDDIHNWIVQPQHYTVCSICYSYDVRLFCERIVCGCVQCRHLNSSSLTTLLDCDKTFKVISNVEDVRKWNITLSR